MHESKMYTDILAYYAFQGAPRASPKTDSQYKLKVSNTIQQRSSCHNFRHKSIKISNNPFRFLHHAFEKKN